MGGTHLVVGTAGHIDHGKTSLIRALTGVDLDRLPEEKARGITIALGFTAMKLPSGRTASFVDVPGHERLVRTMIAGATGLDAVMLCISAVEGVMPQTREHLAILQLLGVKAGLVVLTMADLVDDELLELARMDVTEAVAGTFLEGAPILATAAGPKPMGLEALVAALDALVIEDRPSEGPFRLPVDRCFIKRGFGTVVTGTVRSGTLADGDEVEVAPHGLRARVRGLQVHGEKVQRTRPGLRTAVNLAGIEKDDLARGDVLVRPGEIQLTSILDARIQLLADAPMLLPGSDVRLLIGTTDVGAVLDPLETDLLEPGQSHLAQLRTETPIIALPGDRLILRRPSPADTVGGGVVLDAWAPRARRRDHERVAEELSALEAGDQAVLLLRAGDHGLGIDEARLHGAAGGVQLGDRVLHPARVEALRQQLTTALTAFHQANPLAPGAPTRALWRGPLRALSERAFEALLANSAAAGEIALEGPRARLAGYTVQLTPQQRAAREALLERARLAGLEGVRFDEAAQGPAGLLQLLLDEGALDRVGEMVVHRAALDDLEARVRAFLAAHELMQPADFKTLTGLSRKHAIPLLEWLDARRVTQRVGDARKAR